MTLTGLSFLVTSTGALWEASSKCPKAFLASRAAILLTTAL